MYIGCQAKLAGAIIPRKEKKPNFYDEARLENISRSVTLFLNFEWLFIMSTLLHYSTDEISLIFDQQFIHAKYIQYRAKYR